MAPIVTVVKSSSQTFSSFDATRLMIQLIVALSFDPCEDAVCGLAISKCRELYQFTLERCKESFNERVLPAVALGHSYVRVG